MSQAGLDRQAAERTRCPICRECGGHKLVNGTDCPLQTASTAHTPWYRLGPIAVARVVHGVRVPDGVLGVAVKRGVWCVTAWDGDALTVPVTSWYACIGQSAEDRTAFQRSE